MYYKYKEVFKMQEHKLENFIEQYPEIIEEDLQIIERQKRIGNGTGIIDLLCKDRTGKYVVIEIKIDPDYAAVAQLAKYKVSLEKEGIPKEKIRAILVARYIDTEVQELCNYFKIEAKGMAFGEQGSLPALAVSEQPRKITRALTWRESKIIDTIQKCNAENRYATYEEISKEFNISTACLRGYMCGIIKKGIPIAKKKLKTGMVLFSIKESQEANNSL